MVYDHDTQPVRHDANRRMTAMILAVHEDSAERFRDLIAPGVESFRREMSDSTRTWLTLSGFDAEMLVGGRILAQLVDLFTAGELEIEGPG